MLLLHAVRDRPIRALWLGQVFSAVGDEIYRVAFIWLCVQVLGSQTGYLASLQLIAGLCASIFGARLVDRFHSEQAMIRLDLYRAGIVLIPVLLYTLRIPSFTTLAACSLLLAGMNSLFEPALHETIPKVTADRYLLKAANGLMATTFRLGRVLGPAVIGALSAWVPMIHFFTLDSVTFLASAYAVHSLRIPKAPPKVLKPVTWRSFADNVVEAVELMKSRPPILRSLVAKCATGGAWGLVWGVGFALLADEIKPDDVKVFGMLVSAYGFGNIASALFFGSIQRHDPEKMVYRGLWWLGLFFVLIAVTHSVPLLILFTALSAVGGPWNDLPFADLAQQHYPFHQLGKIYRLRNILDTLAQLILMVASPLLFKIFSVRGVIIGCGVFTIGCGLAGEYYRRKELRAG